MRHRTIDEVTGYAKSLLRHVIDLNEPHLMLQLTSNDSTGIVGLDMDQAQEGMKTAVHLGWIEGEPRSYGPDGVIWQHLHVTVDGLRQAEAWPPAGRENLAGPWDSDHWGAWAKPCLERLQDDPGWGSFPASFGLGEVTDDHRV